MTKGELVRQLTRWPDRTQVEISVSLDGEPVWFEIMGIEHPQQCQETYDHCLIFTGRITME